MCKKRSTRISHALVLCASFRETIYSVNRLQSTSHENSHRGPTRGLIEFNYFYTYSRVNGLCFGYFQFLRALSTRSKITLTLPPPLYVSRLSDHTVVNKYATILTYNNLLLVKMSYPDEIIRCDNV